MRLVLFLQSFGPPRPAPPASTACLPLPAAQVIYSNVVPKLPIAVQYRVFIFDVFILGFIIDTVFVIAVRYRFNLTKYVKRNYFSLFLLLADLYMLGTSTAFLLIVSSTCWAPPSPFSS